MIPKPLEHLLTAVNVGGRGDALNVWKQYARDAGAVVTTDVLGNAYAKVRCGESPEICLSAHIDEIGFIVTSVDEKGMLRIAPIGDWDTAVLVAQRVRIFGRHITVDGVVGVIPMHTRSDEELKVAPEFKDLWVDVGCSDENQVQELGLAPGDIGVIVSDPWEVSDTLVSSRAVDNRVGCYIVLETLRRLAQPEATGWCPPVMGIITAREESDHCGARGIRFNATRVIALDATFATDDGLSEDADMGEFGPVSLGGGPVIYRAPLLSASLERLAFDAAEQNAIDHQVRVLPGDSGTDADHFAYGGAQSILISYPARNMHSPVEIFDLVDVENTIQLLLEICRTIGSAIKV